MILLSSYKEHYEVGIVNFFISHLDNDPESLCYLCWDSQWDWSDTMVLAETMLIVLTINHFPDILYSFYLFLDLNHFTIFVRMLADVHFSHLVIILFIVIGVFMTFFIIDRHHLVRFSSSDPLSKTLLLPLDYFLFIEINSYFYGCCGMVLSCFSCIRLCATLWSVTVHGILRERILEWVAMPSSRGSSQPRIIPTSFKYPALTGVLFTTSISWEAPSFVYHIVVTDYYQIQYFVFSQ